MEKSSRMTLHYIIQMTVHVILSYSPPPLPPHTVQDPNVLLILKSPLLGIIAMLRL